MGDPLNRSMNRSAAAADYINYESVNQDLLHLAKKINGGSAAPSPLPPPPNAKIGQYSSSSLLSRTFNEKVKGALYSSSSRLNYIIPEMLTRSQRPANVPASSEGAAARLDASPGTAQSEAHSLQAKPTALSKQASLNQVVYCDIDFINKTPAFHSIHKS